MHQISKYIHLKTWKNISMTLFTNYPPPQKKKPQQQQIDKQAYEKRKKYKMQNFKTIKPYAKNYQCLMKH